MTADSKREPPKRKAGWGKGSRVFDGEAMDVRSTSALIGQKEWQTRSQIGRGILPYRKLGGRIICLRSEILSYLRDVLPGVSLEQARANLAARKGDE